MMGLGLGLDYGLSGLDFKFHTRVPPEPRLWARDVGRTAIYIFIENLFIFIINIFFFNCIFVPEQLRLFGLVPNNYIRSG